MYQLVGVAFCVRVRVRCLSLPCSVVENKSGIPQLLSALVVPGDLRK